MCVVITSPEGRNALSGGSLHREAHTSVSLHECLASNARRRQVSRWSHSSHQYDERRDRPVSSLRIDYSHPRPACTRSATDDVSPAGQGFCWHSLPYAGSAIAGRQKGRSTLCPPVAQRHQVSIAPATRWTDTCPVQPATSPRSTTDDADNRRRRGRQPEVFVRRFRWRLTQPLGGLA